PGVCLQESQGHLSLALGGRRGGRAGPGRAGDIVHLSISGLGRFAEYYSKLPDLPGSGEPEAAPRLERQVAHRALQPDGHLPSGKAGGPVGHGEAQALPGREVAVNPSIGKWVRFRIALLSLGLALLGLVIIGRFFFLQVVRGPQLREEATREYQKYSPVLPVRGMILDRRGLELAISTRVSSVVAHPTQVTQAERLSRELAPILGYQPKELKEMLTRACSFTWVKRQLTPEREVAFLAWQAEAERKAEAAKSTARRDTDAVYLLPEAKRYYPQLSLAGEVLGFC